MALAAAGGVGTADFVGEVDAVANLSSGTHAERTAVELPEGSAMSASAPESAQCESAVGRGVMAGEVVAFAEEAVKWKGKTADANSRVDDVAIGNVACIEDDSAADGVGAAVRSTSSSKLGFDGAWTVTRASSVGGSPASLALACFDFARLAALVFLLCGLGRTLAVLSFNCFALDSLP